jgi:hypothetical protein
VAGLCRPRLNSEDCSWLFGTPCVGAISPPPLQSSVDRAQALVRDPAALLKHPAPEVPTTVRGARQASFAFSQGSCSATPHLYRTPPCCPAHPFPCLLICPCLSWLRRLQYFAPVIRRTTDIAPCTVLLCHPLGTLWDMTFLVEAPSPPRYPARHRPRHVVGGVQSSSTSCVARTRWNHLSLGASPWHPWLHLGW